MCYRKENISRFKILDLNIDLDTSLNKKREDLQRKREEKGCCEHCGSKENVSWIFSRTQYVWHNSVFDPYWELENPNRKLFLCENCAAEYNDYYDEMWQDYYGGCL